MYKAGQLFYDRYELMTLLGRGGFSEVWKAKDTKSDVILAIKIFIKQDEEGVKLCMAEYQKTHALNHPNILTPVFFDEYQGAPFLVMPYCSGGTIAQKMGKLDQKELTKVIHQIGSALNYLHNRTNPIAHGDIKPDNILIDEEGNFLLTDFGISEQLKSKLHKTLATQGMEPAPKQSGITPLAYRAPELFFFKGQPANPASEKTDIWAFGACLYQVATGELPFNGEGGITQKIAKAQGHENTFELIGPFPKTLPKGVAQLIQQCLSLDQWSRPTAREIAQWTPAKKTKIKIQKLETKSPKPSDLPLETKIGKESTDENEKAFPFIFVYVGLGAALLIIILLSIWVTFNGPAFDAMKNATSPDSSKVQQLTDGEMADSLKLWTEKAWACFDKGQFIYPENNSTLFYIKKSLEQDPYHDPSLELETLVAEEFEDQGFEAYADDDYEKAIELLNTSLQVVPYNPSVEELIAECENRLAAQNAQEEQLAQNKIKDNTPPKPLTPKQKKTEDTPTTTSTPAKKDTSTEPRSKKSLQKPKLTKVSIDVFFSSTIYFLLHPTKTITSTQGSDLKGQTVSFKLKNDLILDNQVILPSGTIFSGEVATVRDFSGRNIKKRDSSIKINFEQIKIPGKTTIPISKGILKETSDDAVTLQPTELYRLELDGDRETDLKNYVLSLL